MRFSTPPEFAQRIRSTFTQSVLSAWWGYEDGDENWPVMLALVYLFL